MKRYRDLDIIIPVFNEQQAFIDGYRYFDQLSKIVSIIFVDGGSKDSTIEYAKQFGTVIESSKGRGIQKNKGINYSSSKYILILHVDTRIESASLGNIINLLNNDIDGGCMTLKILDKKVIFRIFEWIINFRSKYFHVLDGDCGLFVKKQVLKQIGCFENVKVMEDIKISKSLKSDYKLAVLEDKISVSSRKWYQQGFLKTTMTYSFNYMRFWLNQLLLRG